MKLTINIEESTVVYILKVLGSTPLPYQQVAPIIQELNEEAGAFKTKLNQAAIDQIQKEAVAKKLADGEADKQPATGGNGADQGNTGKSGKPIHQAARQAKQTMPDKESGPRNAENPAS